MKLTKLFRRKRTAPASFKTEPIDNLAPHIPTKSKALKALIQAGAPVETVIDVGVQNMTHELITHFGDTPHILCEPISEYYDKISKHYASCGVEFDIEPSAMSNADGSIELELSSVIEGLDITHARIIEGAGSVGTVRRQVASKRVDTMVGERGLDGPFLLKIDVDGAEILVLEGATDTLAKCSAVVIEVETRNLFERSAPLVAAGFRLFDVVDLCLYDNRLSQVDLVFANPSYFQPGALDVVQGAFEFSKWVDLSSVAEAN